MKKKTYQTLCLLMLLLVTSCGISEDCFKGNGTLITQAYPFEDFTKIKVYNGIALVIKEGTNYEVKVVTSDNISKELDFQITEGMLVIKDNSTCNMDRVYGQTTVYITTPNLEEIYSKTEQDIKSDGILRFPILRLFSFGDDGDGAGTGDFYLDVDNSQLVVESNNVSNYYLNGKCQEFIVNFYFGDGRLKGENLIAQNIYIYNRGSNDMFVYPVQKIEGTIVSTGNVILKNVPQIINVVELFTGKLIY